MHGCLVMDVCGALVADRFFVTNGMHAIDLATGDRVELVVSIGGGPAEQARWAVRCGWFAALNHRRLARLIDYGSLGAGHRFEAWRAGGAGRADGIDGPSASREPSESTLEQAVAAASDFLRACGRTVGDPPAGAVRDIDGHAVVLPDAAAGYESDAARPSPSNEEMRFEHLGLITVARPAVAALAEAVVEAGERPNRAFALTGSRGAGTRTAILDLARDMRRQGIVPLSIRAITPAVVAALPARPVLVIAPGDPSDGWRALVDLSAQAVCPRAIVFCGAHDVGGVHVLRLERLPVETLCDAVAPRILPDSQRRIMAAMAQRAQGLPARFAMLLWGSQAAAGSADPQRSSNAGPSQAAETTAVYGEVSTAAISSDPIEASAPSWPSPGELAALRGRVRVGAAELAAGRHAAGDRILRQAGAFLARRCDWPHAAEAALSLAASLLRRGQTRGAQSALAEAQRAASEGGLDGALVRVSILSGQIAADELRLEAAERLLSAAVVSADGLGEHEAVAEARLALARCLFWRGAYAAAEQTLAAVAEGELPAALLVRLAVERSRTAVGRGDVDRAVSQAAVARTQADATSAAELVALAAYAEAFAHLAVGDTRAVGPDAMACIRAARRAHDPLLALRARLIAVEACRRTGVRGPAGKLTRLILRMDGQRLPPIVAGRARLLADVLSESDAAAAAIRHAQSTGLVALSLFVPARTGASDVGRTVQDVVEILRCCQAAEEDARILTTVCERLRDTLQAAAVAFFVEQSGVRLPVVSVGGRLDPAFAARASEADDVLLPGAGGSLLDGGAAVRYSGQRLGALVVRWPAGSGADLRSAAILLTIAAAAAGPALSGVVRRHAAPPGAAHIDMLGASGAICEVRRAVDRAARAPFAVLIEGESGSGKELVARALHRGGPRKDKPFCPLNCAALPDDLVESELFGHARGAFTGASVERAGVFEEAHGGTLFLDEIGELSLRAQAKVLRTIQDGELRRVGENVSRRVDVRLIAASNRNLPQEVAAGRFRVDLLYRLDVIRIAVPPLRDRREDIAVLAEHFWCDATARLGSRATLATATLAALARYDWPGNVRELQNVLSALAVGSPRRGVVPPSALPSRFDGARADPSWRLDEARRAFERRFVCAALARSGGHRARTAVDLGLTRQGLSKLMGRLGLDEAEAPGDALEGVEALAAWSDRL